MRLVTYNIWNGGRNDSEGDRRPAILEILRDLRPDLLVLTEASGFGDGLLAEWQGGLEMDGAMAHARSGFDLVVLVRSPCRILSSNSIHPHVFYHACLSVRVATSREELTLLGTHLNPFDPASRLVEARHLAREAYASRPVLLAGDLNGFAPSDAVHESVRALPPRFLARHILDPTDPGRFDTRAVGMLEYAGYEDLFRKLHPKDPGWTVPTSIGTPYSSTRMRLDYALATPPLAARARRAEVVRNPRTDVASDHYPLLVDFE